MKNSKHYLLIWFLVLVFTITTYALAKTNALTHQRTNALPNRIVSLKPNITEILFAIGAGNEVVGVTTWCDRPEDVKKLPKAADYINPNVEKILSLRPDLIITSEENSIRRPIEMLKKSGIPVLLLPFKTVDDLLTSIEKIGEATGHTREASLIVEREASLVKREAWKHIPLPFGEGLGEGESTPPLTPTLSPEGRGSSNALPRPKVLAIVGKRPLIAVGPKTFLGEIIEIAGGKNIVESKMSYPHISMETVIAKKPDVILDLTMGSESREADHVKREAWKPIPLPFREGLGEGESTPPLTPALSPKGRGDSNASRFTNDEQRTTSDVQIYNLDISDFRAGPRLGEQIQQLSKLIK